MIQVLFTDKRHHDITITIYDFSSFDDLIEKIKTHMCKIENSELTIPPVYIHDLIEYTTKQHYFEKSFFESEEYKEWYEKFNETKTAIYNTIKGHVEITILKNSLKNNLKYNPIETTISLGYKKDDAILTRSYNKWLNKNKAFVFQPEYDSEYDSEYDNSNDSSNIKLQTIELGEQTDDQILNLYDELYNNYYTIRHYTKKENLKDEWSIECLKDMKGMEQLFSNNPTIYKELCTYFNSYKDYTNFMIFHYKKADKILRVYSCMVVGNEQLEMK